MGFGSFIKKAVDPINMALSGVGFLGDKFLDKGTILGSDFLGTGMGLGLVGGKDAQGRPLQATPEQITAANVFSKLTPEQQKDIMINNPNIVTPGGKQFFDPLTNTLKLEESPFQSAQRQKQEKLAADLSGSLSGVLPTVDPASLAQTTFSQASQLLDPEFKLQRRQLEQQLADQGLPIGSEASNEAINRLEASQGTQRRQLALSSVLQGIQTGEAQRAARFNEISSLLGTQQVGGIGFGQFQPQKSGLDLLGVAEAEKNRAFQFEQGRKQRSQQKRDAIFGAVGELGGAAIGAFASDLRLKENIVEVGISPTGLSIIDFDYIDKSIGQGRYRGVSAQEVEKVKPEAITYVNGYRAVNYDMIDVDFIEV